MSDLPILTALADVVSLLVEGRPTRSSSPSSSSSPASSGPRPGAVVPNRIVPLVSVVPGALIKATTFDATRSLPAGWLGHILATGLAERAQFIAESLARKSFGFNPYLYSVTPPPVTLFCGWGWEWLDLLTEPTAVERARKARADNDVAWLRTYLNQTQLFRSKGWSIATPPAPRFATVATQRTSYDAEGARWILWSTEVIRWNAAANGLVPERAPEWWREALGTWGMPTSSAGQSLPDVGAYHLAMKPPFDAAGLDRVMRFVAAECVAPGWRSAPFDRSVVPTRKAPLYRANPELGTFLWPREAEILPIDRALKREERAAALRNIMPYFQAGVAAIQVIVSVIGSYAGGAAGPALGAAVGVAGQAAIMAGSEVLTSTMLRTFKGIVQNPSGGLDWGATAEGAVTGMVNYAGNNALGEIDQQFERWGVDDYRRQITDATSTLNRVWGWGNELIGAIGVTPELTDQIVSNS